MLDIIYTQEAMEHTEGKVAKMLFDHKVNIADIESNNGGKGFARAVESILQQQFQTNKTSIGSTSHRTRKQGFYLTPLG